MKEDFEQWAQKEGILIYLLQNQRVYEAVKALWEDWQFLYQSSLSS